MKKQKNYQLTVLSRMDVKTDGRTFDRLVLQQDKADKVLYLECHLTVTKEVVLYSYCCKIQRNATTGQIINGNIQHWIQSS